MNKEEVLRLERRLMAQVFRRVYEEEGVKSRQIEALLAEIEARELPQVIVKVSGEIENDT